MTALTLDLKKGLPVNEYGIVGIGSVNLDYILRKAHIQKKGENIHLKDKESFKVIDPNGRLLLEIKGPYVADSTNQEGYSLTVDEKHTCKNQDSGVETTFVLGKDIDRRAGGGVVNLGKSFIAQSSVPFGILSLRGEGCLEKLVDGTYQQSVEVKGQKDQGNLIFNGTNVRTIIRGVPLNYTGREIYLNPDFGFNIGTIVINSLDSLHLTHAAINLYNQETQNHGPVMGILALTPKMSESYELIAKEAIPNGFIPVFNPVDLIKYAYRDKKGNGLNLKEEDITYSHVINALQRVRKEQNGKGQRMYVTLGEFGSLGVSTNGFVYRVDVFDIYGTNKTGAGDTFAATITKYEHNRFMNRSQRVPIYEVLAYATAASTIHINGSIPYIAEIYEKLMSEGHAHYETLGKLGMLNPGCKEFGRSLKEMGRGPVTGKYFTMKFQ